MTPIDAPTSAIQGGGLEGRAAELDDDHLNDDRRREDEEEKFVFENALKYIEFIVDDTAANEQKKLQEHERIEHNRLELLGFAIIELKDITIEQHGTDDKLEDGLTKDHFPHRKCNKWGSAGFGRTVQQVQRRRVDETPTQSSCTAVSTLFSFGSATADTNVSSTAVTLTVSWNCKNFLTASLTHLPHMMALTMLEKLSSIRMMLDASLATSVPVIPIENPTSAILSAGPSFVPSPVTATISPSSLSLRTSTRLSSGLDRASTCSLGMIASISEGGSFLNTGPSMTIPPCVWIPHCLAILLAVRTLSPVTIRTKTPAF
ncbi:hypothetical protein BC937DRAFT_87735 [Endogone sp. FLAS-F59071]|nr:hypothetical protein BC937DRAFT_87735 [Endogone sp. FLAS-F59071]|eukprot:RUS22692.1 hypothetical protein BC937DRAFT_87735 [Endogone sp. FLAS-F59071]